MSNAIDFPGTPTVQTANASAGGTATCTLPAPPSGHLQYLSGFIICGVQSAANQAANATFSHLDVGSGSQPVFIYWSGASGSEVLDHSFPSGWPADAIGASISLSIVTTAGMSTVTITLFGYNVPQ